MGALGGYGIASAAVWLRDRELLSTDFDGWLSVPAVLTVYGLTELVGAYGFLAAFAAGVAFRRHEHTHEHNRRVHDGAEVVEKFGELAVILLIGSMLSWNGLAAPGLSGWLLVPVLLLVIRPAAVFLSLLGSKRDWKERAFVAWFGVRGIGSLYYLAVAVGTGVLAGDATVVVWTALACVVVSVFVHGVTATPFARRVTRSHCARGRRALRLRLPPALQRRQPVLRLDHGRAAPSPGARGRGGEPVHLLAPAGGGGLVEADALALGGDARGGTHQAAVAAGEAPPRPNGPRRPPNRLPRRVPFDDDTALRPIGDGAWEGAVVDGWNTPRGPLGGYVMAIVMRGLELAVADPERQAALGDHALPACARARPGDGRGAAWSAPAAR